MPNACLYAVAAPPPKENKYMGGYNAIQGVATVSRGRLASGSYKRHVFVSQTERQMCQFWSFIARIGVLQVGALYTRHAAPRLFLVLSRSPPQDCKNVRRLAFIPPVVKCLCQAQRLLASTGIGKLRRVRCCALGVVCRHNVFLVIRRVFAGIARFILRASFSITSRLLCVYRNIKPSRSRRPDCYACAGNCLSHLDHVVPIAARVQEYLAASDLEKKAFHERGLRHLGDDDVQMPSGRILTASTTVRTPRHFFFCHDLNNSRSSTI